MPVTVGVPRETFPGERRVALTPRACEAIGKLGASVVVERSAGAEAGYPDDQYLARGASLVSRPEVFAESERNTHAGPSKVVRLELIRPDRVGLSARRTVCFR